MFFSLSFSLLLSKSIKNVFLKVLFSYILSLWNIFELMFAQQERFRSTFIFLFEERCLMLSAPFVKRIIFSLLKCFFTFAINQLGVEVNGNGGEGRHPKVPLHKSNTNFQKIIKINFSVFWDLTKTLQQLEGIISRKNYDIFYGVFTCLTRTHLSSTLL